MHQPEGLRRGPAETGGSHPGGTIGNTGGNVLALNFVTDWRFLNAFDGNFTLRANIGLPIYEDLNYAKVSGPARNHPA